VRISVNKNSMKNKNIIILIIIALAIIAALLYFLNTDDKAEIKPTPSAINVSSLPRASIQSKQVNKFEVGQDSYGLTSSGDFAYFINKDNALVRTNLANDSSEIIMSVTLPDNFKVNTFAVSNNNKFLLINAFNNSNQIKRFMLNIEGKRISAIPPLSDVVWGSGNVLIEIFYGSNNKYELVKYDVENNKSLDKFSLKGDNFMSLLGYDVAADVAYILMSFDDSQVSTGNIVAVNLKSRQESTVVDNLSPSDIFYKDDWIYYLNEDGIFRLGRKNNYTSQRIISSVLIPPITLSYCDAIDVRVYCVAKYGDLDTRLVEIKDGENPRPLERYRSGFIKQVKVLSNNPPRVSLTGENNIIEILQID